MEAGCSERISKRQIAKRTQEILEAQRQPSLGTPTPALDRSARDVADHTDELAAALLASVCSHGYTSGDEVGEVASGPAVFT